MYVTARLTSGVRFRSSPTYRRSFDEYNLLPLPPASQCGDGIDNDADGLIDLDDPGCSDISDNNESDDFPQRSITNIKSDDISQESITQPETGSLRPLTPLLLFCAIVTLRRRAEVS